MNDTEFDHWCTRNRIGRDTRETIARIRASQPSRLVRAAAGNMPVRYPSRKMGWIVQGESHRNEWVIIIDMEYDDDVLEYYDQPDPIWLQYKTKGGKKGRPVRHTPDAFVIRCGGAGYEEYKTAEDLARLVVDMPNRYRQSGDGHWVCPPGEEAAGKVNLSYRVRSSAEINPAVHRNRIFLEEYFRPERLDVDEDAAAAVTALVAAEPAITLADLLQQVLADEMTADTVYALIVLDRIYVDLRRYPLPERDRVPVFPNETMGQAYLVATAADDPDSGGTHAIDVAPDSIVTWDGKPLRIVNVGRNETTFMSEQGHIVALPNAAFEALVKEGKILGVATEAGPGMSVDAWNLFMQASPRDQKDAVQRHDIIRPYLDGHPPADDETPGRTIRRWVRNWRVAAEGLGCGLVGLLPRYKDCGFRGPRLPEAVTTLMTTYIEERYEDLKQRSVRSVYGDFLIACDDATKKDSAFITPSYQAFRLAVKARRGPRQTRKRKGSRAAYQEEPFYWELGPTTPRHGDHPWQIVHLDHTEVDLELLYENGQNAGKCWLSLATAANPRRFLAVYLSYDPPSYRSCMMLLRILVRRWGRLPQIIVVDGGPEFRSTYFETVLARYEVTKKTRPQARPRHGSVCERLFGTTSTQFIYNLRGNTQIMKLVRQVTKGNNPKNHACWTLEYLYRYLCAYAYEVYDTISHPALGVSPRDAYNAGIMLTGERKHRLVPYDEQFRLLTMPTTPKGTAMVHRSDGVKINSFYYWNEAFRSPLLAKAQVPVRYDPFDVGVAYAYMGGQWVRCISEHYHALHGRSEREVRTATAALREQARAHGQTFVLTARKLADFLATAQGQEAVFEQRLRDDEQKRVLAIIAGDSEAVTTGIESGDRQPACVLDREGADRGAEPVTQLTDAPSSARSIDRGNLKPYGDF